MRSVGDMRQSNVNDLYTCAVFSVESLTRVEIIPVSMIFGVLFVCLFFLYVYVVRFFFVELNFNPRDATQCTK